jgi:hypothetical protein
MLFATIRMRSRRGLNRLARLEQVDHVLDADAAVSEPGSQSFAGLGRSTRVAAGEVLQRRVR